MADGMQIVMLAGEAVPYAKVGGLADVIGGLPPHLEKLGASVSVVLPRYRTIDLQSFGFEPFPLPADLQVPLGSETITCDVHVSTLPQSQTKVFLIGIDRFFDRDGIYLDSATGRDYLDQSDRWIAFQHAAMEFIRLALPPPDILHSHDYHTALAPAYLARLYRNQQGFQHTASVFTIHNMGYQGLFPAGVVDRAGFDPSEFFSMGPFEYYGKVSFMKTGILFADAVTTVSETYAREIQTTTEYGCGLEGVLRGLPHAPVGILNGIDQEVWNPAQDPWIKRAYDANNLDAKRENKRAVLQAFGLSPDRMDPPLLAMISRIDPQKGFDLVTEILDDLLTREVSFILLGSGDKLIENQLQLIARRYPDRAGVHFGYSNELAHLVEAGADIFLMPSKYEPCGLNQMYSMRYGTVPVVRATGGLADTVEEFNPQTRTGTGFRFDAYTPGDFRDAVTRALHYWQDQSLWRALMGNGMAADFSWEKSARKYIDVYDDVRARHRR